VVERVALALAVLAFALALLALVQARVRRRDPTDEALARLQALVAEETTSAAEELKSRLARMRADALSSLVEEERRIADKRRHEFADRERAAGEELAEALAGAARRVDERLRTWGDDLDRAQQSLETDLRRLEQ
jgi:gas vesicle protein